MRAIKAVKVRNGYWRGYFLNKRLRWIVLKQSTDGKPLNFTTKHEAENFASKAFQQAEY